MAVRKQDEVKPNGCCSQGRKHRSMVLKMLSDSRSLFRKTEAMEAARLHKSQVNHPKLTIQALER